MSTPSIDWAAIASSPAFRQLHQGRKRLQWLLLSMALPYFFLLPVSTAYFQAWLAQPVFGVMNVGLLFALSQFVLAWGVAWVYVVVANRHFDQQAKRIVAEFSTQLSNSQGDHKIEVHV